MAEVERPVAPTPDVAELRYLGELLEWSNELAQAPWDFDPLAGPDSAYAKWVRLTSPAAILALLDHLPSEPADG